MWTYELPYDLPKSKAIVWYAFLEFWQTANWYLLYVSCPIRSFYQQVDDFQNGGTFWRCLGTKAWTSMLKNTFFVWMVIMVCLAGWLLVHWWWWFRRWSFGSLALLFEKNWWLVLYIIKFVTRWQVSWLSFQVDADNIFLFSYCVCNFTFTWVKLVSLYYSFLGWHTKYFSVSYVKNRHQIDINIVTKMEN